MEPSAPEPPDVARLSGPERAATLMLALGREHGGPLWPLLAEHEVLELSATMARLGRLSKPAVEHLAHAFARDMGEASVVQGSLEATERLLTDLLPPERASAILAEIKGPPPRGAWDRLAKVDEGAFAAYLAGEAPRTAAVVLRQLAPDHAARVAARLPEPLAGAALARMAAAEPVSEAVLAGLEATLIGRFVVNAAAPARDPNASLADVFDALDRDSEARLMRALATEDAALAERVKALMFTFEHLAGLPPRALQQLVSRSDKAVLAKALHGAPEPLAEAIFASMSERAGRLLKEEMEGARPRRRDVEAARLAIVRTAKSLAAEGEIVLAEAPEDEDLQA